MLLIEILATLNQARDEALKILPLLENTAIVNETMSEILPY